ncbi:MAG: RNA polymerase sigma factor SigF [Prochloron sp. SP5CPC1]|nr:RNA polymerase sigma factor SigF [Candidatus Paraprochloron terpiosi SP5CPC1]
MSTNLTDDVKLQSLCLFKAYQQSRRIDLRNKLVELNFGLVKKEAHHWVEKCNESYEDLLQLGSLGLILAIERFDYSRGSAFSSFAIPYIRGEIQHYLRDQGSQVRIPRRWVEQKRQAVGTIRDFCQRFNRQPTDPEIAQELEISLKEWEEIKLADKNREPLSLDLSLGDNNYGAITFGELIEDPQYRSFQLATDDRIRLQQALTQLEERTRKVLEFVFLHDLTQKEAAKLLGISVVTVARHAKKGVNMLQKLIGTED